MLIIGVTGKKRHGKDTISDYLRDVYGFKKYVLADTLKYGIKELFGMTNEQLWGDLKEEKDSFWGYSPREIMQIIGTDLIRNRFDKDFFVKSLKKKIMEDNCEKVVISDIRFLNEVKLVEELGGTILRVNRETENNKDNHISENELDNHNFITVRNNSTLENLFLEIDASSPSSRANVPIAPDVV